MNVLHFGRFLLAYTHPISRPLHSSFAMQLSIPGSVVKLHTFCCNYLAWGSSGPLGADFSAFTICIIYTTARFFFLRFFKCHPKRVYFALRYFISHPNAVVCTPVTFLSFFCGPTLCVAHTQCGTVIDSGYVKFIVCTCCLCMQIVMMRKCSCGCSCSRPCYSATLIP